MSQLVRLEGKHSTQNAHCAMTWMAIMTSVVTVISDLSHNDENENCAEFTAWICKKDLDSWGKFDQVSAVKRF